ncbi:phospholipase D-like domain-containing protein [Parapedobacter tibetensis]|uniref:phospholipase D-like domain-containing protein n=1 Tax=Parapedobacter tibetensis TaxID=2972951 RepID=UPI00214D7CBC|nr:phospholipase D-like domain-containing protein [Parapedobacter tibetensis]
MPEKKTANHQDYYPNQKVRLLLGGNAYFTLLIQLIEQAKEHIHLQVYIYEPDETGQQVADALIAAAKRGVTVYILVDGYGSQGLKKTFTRQFEENGVHFRFFEPLFKSKNFYVGRRMHQKVFVVDAHCALVTGANIGDRYNDKPGQAAWLDFALYVEGEIAIKLCELCWMTWKNFQRIRHIPRCEVYPTKIDFGPKETCAVRMCRNDWVRRKHEISRTYAQILRNAEAKVIILSSYFLPGTAIQNHIKAAVKRGVNVRLIICSRMDVPLVKDAERFMYGWLLRHHVEIYEYTGEMLHGKLATCDEEWMTIGSFNVNDLSAKVSVELNLDVQGEAFVQHTIRELESIMQNHCIRVCPDSFSNNNGLLTRFMRWFSFKMLRIIFFLGTFYMKQEKRRND